MDTYANLQASVSTWMARQDLDPQIPDFIRIVEAQLNNTPKFRVQEMIYKLQLQVTGSEISTPADYLGMRLLRLRDGAEIPWSAPSLLHQGVDCDGVLRYTDLGNTLELNAELDAVDVDLFYYQKIPSLSDTNTTNWLLDLVPNVYLYGALVAASAFLKDDPRIPIWVQQYNADVVSLIDADKVDRWSGPVSVRLA